MTVKAAKNGGSASPAGCAVQLRRIELLASRGFSPNAIAEATALGMKHIEDIVIRRMENEVGRRTPDEQFRQQLADLEILKESLVCTTEDDVPANLELLRLALRTVQEIGRLWGFNGSPRRGGIPGLLA